MIKPNMERLIEDTAEAVRWMRSQMVSAGTRDDNDPGGLHGPAGPKPPLRVSYMDGADREVRNLAHWITEYGSPLPRGLWRVNGEVRGLRGDDWDVLNQLVGTLFALWSRFGELPGMFDEFWKIRSQHYANWPKLAGLLESVNPDPIVEEVEEPQEALF